MHPEENISEDIKNKVESEEEIIKDKEQKEDHCSKASSDVSSRSEPYLNPEDDKYKYKMWLKVGLLVPAQRDQQIAFLLDALKCDKSEVHSIYQFFDIFGFHASLTDEEADKFSELEQVDFVGPPSRLWRRQQQTKSRRKTYTVIKIKKRKCSTGSILSERRKNREKWRYNEDLERGTKIQKLEEESDLELGTKIQKLEEELDLELGTKIEVLEEESEDYCSSDSSDSYDGSEFYLPFDESGKRWYYVSLVYGKRPDDHEALLLATLDCDESEIPSIYQYYGVHHMFKAYMSEEEADKVAGLEEVEFVEPCRRFGVCGGLD